MTEQLFTAGSKKMTVARQTETGRVRCHPAIGTERKESWVEAPGMTPARLRSMPAFPLQEWRRCFCVFTCTDSGCSKP
jgi:hypothetical protein